MESEVIAEKCWKINFIIVLPALHKELSLCNSSLFTEDFTMQNAGSELWQAEA